MPAPHIKIDDLSDGAVEALLTEHHREMFKYSPPESVHALDTAALRKPGLTFWSAWFDEELAGCGALLELDAQHGEIKSMRTVAHHLRKGVAAALLERIIAEARERGHTRLSLETGTPEAFAPARRLYERFGFVVCPPFANYREDPFSVCMSRDL
jgi:putative acetyltransferase